MWIITLAKLISALFVLSGVISEASSTLQRHVYTLLHRQIASCLRWWVWAKTTKKSCDQQAWGGSDAQLRTANLGVCAVMFPAPLPSFEGEPLIRKNSSGDAYQQAKTIFRNWAVNMQHAGRRADEFWAQV